MTTPIGHQSVYTATRLSADSIQAPFKQKSGFILQRGQRLQLAGPVGGLEMNSESVRNDVQANDYLERATLCLPDFPKQAVSQCGDEGFIELLPKYLDSPESNASERLVKLKQNLRDASTYDFWGILLEEMSDILEAQCGFVAKRILVDDENTAVEMPPLGDPGSCLLGVGFYLNNGADVKNMSRDYKYHAYGSPCAYMKNDKVFIIPERMSEFIPDNPNALPWKQSEAFIGVPLFYKGKSFAHFGAIWSSEGASKRRLSWSFIEMFMHSLEDMILQRILEGRGFAKESALPRSAPAGIIPLNAITASQSLKPYARSLSHELRTPMQGVVGMLDIMHSTVMDAMDAQTSEVAKSVFEELKTNIETVQESSKRAIEAADNVVHAYDLNMQMPETPFADEDNRSEKSYFTSETRGKPRPDIVIEGSGISLSPTGRKRLRSEELDFHPGPPLKRLTAMADGGGRGKHSVPSIQPTGAMVKMSGAANKHIGESRGRQQSIDTPVECGSRNSSTNKRTSSTSPPPSSLTNQQIVILEFMRALLHDAVRINHPFSKKCTQTEYGEKIEIITEGPHTQKQVLVIHLMVDPEVPDSIYTVEHHLQFALQKVLDNAIKFTDNGVININVNLGHNPQLLDIRISDTGCGITEESKMHLFKPHFQEDASLSRAKDGLGLSLFNAKAHVRRNLGGDITLERSATEGPFQGSEFLIRIPASISKDPSRSNTPRPETPIPRSCPPSRTNSPQNLATANKMSLPPAPTSIPIPRRQSFPLLQTPRGTRRFAFNGNLARDIPLTFLVAEDNAINRQILVNYLKKLGYEMENIIQAYDGVEAVQQYRESLSRPPEKRVNAVLMDLWMPNMDGYEATEKILEMARKNGETLAVMAVTADITSESLEKAKETGMKGFISKPYRVLDIEHLILQHFRDERIGV